jgi:asparagine synthase (glutamine-hydrolysing)
MSGVAGIVRFDGQPVLYDLLQQMHTVLRHRGADGMGIWQSPLAGLIHAGRHITPESSFEPLPYRSNTSGAVITADARLDNREDLIGEIGIADHEVPDSQIILRAYEKWGQDCPDRLIGDFAFALWDPARQQLFCARDAMGVRPFYYFDGPSCFAFGSEIKAILQVPDIPRRLDETTVGDYLCHVFQDPEVTFYRDIRRLPPGCSLTVGDGKCRTSPYWSPDPKREIRLRSDAEYAEAFRSLFTAAVRCRLRSQRPLGSTLSGGLDSSSIVCTARDLLRQSNRPPLYTFSAIFPGLPEKQLARIDERNYIHAVVRAGGIEPSYVEADRISPLADLDRVLWLHDEPAFGPNMYIHRALHHAASERGVGVMLDGLDGDTTVSHGFDYLAQLLQKGRWISLAKEAGALARQYEMPTANIIWRFAVRPSAPEAAVEAWRFVRGRRQFNHREIGLLNYDFAQRTGLIDRLNTAAPRRLLPLSPRMNHLDSIRSPLMTYALELVDRSAAAFSLEARYPFFDRRLIEFSLALPLSQKLSQGWTRMILRRAMQGILPAEIQWRRTKGDLSPSFVHGFLRTGRTALERALSEDASLIEPYLNLSALRQMFDQSITAPRKSSEDSLTLFGVVMFSNWLRKAKVSH